MKKTTHRVILLLIFIGFIFASCSAGNKMSGGSSKKCGCGLNKGFVGY